MRWCVLLLGGCLDFGASRFATSRLEEVAMPAPPTGETSTPGPLVPSGPMDTTAPVVTIAFLPPHSITDKPSVVVRGTATDEAALKSLLLNGVAVTLGSDGVFSATAPLSAGDNRLNVTAEDAAGNVGTASVHVERVGFAWSDVSEFSVDATSGKVAFYSPSSNALLLRSLTSGDTVLAMTSLGLTGLSHTTTTDGRAYFNDNNRLNEINFGAQTTMPDSANLAQPPAASAVVAGFVLYPDGAVIRRAATTGAFAPTAVITGYSGTVADVVAGKNADVYLKTASSIYYALREPCVSPCSTQNKMSIGALGNGALAYDSQGDRLLFLEGDGAGRLLSMTAAPTGNSVTEVFASGVIPALGWSELSSGPNQTLYATGSKAMTVYSVSLANGASSPLFDYGVGSGTHMVDANFLLRAAGRYLLGHETGITAIDPDTGNRSTLASFAIRRFELATQGASQAYLIAKNDAEFATLDPATGALGAKAITGVQSDLRSWVAVDEGRGRLYVGSLRRPNNRIYMINLADGVQQVFMDPVLNETFAGVYEASSDQLFFADEDKVYATRVSDAAHAKTIVSGVGVGSGPTWTNASALLLQPTRILASTSEGLFAIDRATGNRTQLSTASTEISLVGNPSPRTWFLSASADPNVLACANSAAGFLTLFDTATTQFVILSR